MESQPLLQNEGFGGWLKNSVSAKLIFIGILILLLLIPSAWITSLIQERQERQQTVVHEIGQKWAGEQVLGATVLVIPYRAQLKTVVNKETRIEEVTRYAYLLPEALDIQADVQTELLHRGIFDAAVYQATIKLKGAFGQVDLHKLGIGAEALYWEKARVILGLGDLKGLTNSPVFTVDSRSYPTETNFGEMNVFNQSLTAAPPLGEKKSTAMSFSVELHLRGSEALRVMHLAKHTAVSIQGNWGSPSFDGFFLPQTRDVTDSGFTATWKVPPYTRALPQQWTADALTIEAAPWMKKEAAYNDVAVVAPVPAVKDVKLAETFGVSFLQPVDHYQKTMRTAKYGILIILLTFVALFFTEVIVRKQVHVIQYLLVGAAMIVYYSLLLSFTEQVGFNMAYLISSVATVILVSLFIASLLKNRKAALLFALILSVFYVFIYVIIQLQDQALLFGSIGLFVTIALLMYFSGKINWLRPLEK